MKINAVSILLLFVIGIFGASDAEAETYYVDALYGSDGLEGTSPEAAWRSLERAGKQLYKTGDSLLLRAGQIHEGHLKLKGSGSKQQPILLSKYGMGSLPQIQANGRSRAAIHLFNVDGWVICQVAIPLNRWYLKAERLFVPCTRKTYSWDSPRNQPIKQRSYSEI